MDAVCCLSTVSNMQGYRVAWLRQGVWYEAADVAGA